jgi:hypothetical protein
VPTSGDVDREVPAHQVNGHAAIGVLQGGGAWERGVEGGEAVVHEADSCDLCVHATMGMKGRTKVQKGSRTLYLVTAHTTSLTLTCAVDVSIGVMTQLNIVCEKLFLEAERCVSHLVN